MSQTEITKQKTPPPLPPGLDSARVLSARQGAELLGISLATFRRMHWSGRLPAPVQLSTRRIGWKLRDLLAYADSCAAA